MSGRTQAPLLSTPVPRQRSSFLGAEVPTDERQAELEAAERVIQGLRTRLAEITDKAGQLSANDSSEMTFLATKINLLTEYKASKDAVALYLAYKNENTSAVDTDYFDRACCLKTYDTKPNAFMDFLKRAQTEFDDSFNHRLVYEPAEAFIKKIIHLHQKADNGRVIPSGFGRMMKHPLSLIPGLSTIGLTFLLLYVDHRTTEHADSRFLGFDYLALLQCALLLTAGKAVYAGLLAGAAKCLYKDNADAYVHQASKQLYGLLTGVQSLIFKFKVLSLCFHKTLGKIASGIHELLTNKFFALPALLVAGFMSKYTGSSPFSEFHLINAVAGAAIGVGVLGYLEGHWFRQAAAKGIGCVASAFSCCMDFAFCCNRGPKPMSEEDKRKRVWAPGSTPVYQAAGYGASAPTDDSCDSDPESK